MQKQFFKKWYFIFLVAIIVLVVISRFMSEDAKTNGSIRNIDTTEESASSIDFKRKQNINKTDNLFIGITINKKFRPTAKSNLLEEQKLTNDYDTAIDEYYKNYDDDTRSKAKATMQVLNVLGAGEDPSLDDSSYFLDTGSPHRRLQNVINTKKYSWGKDKDPKKLQEYIKNKDGYYYYIGDMRKLMYDENNDPGYDDVLDYKDAERTEKYYIGKLTAAAQKGDITIEGYDPKKPNPKIIEKAFNNILNDLKNLRIKSFHTHKLPLDIEISEDEPLYKSLLKYKRKLKE